MCEGNYSITPCERIIYTYITYVYRVKAENKNEDEKSLHLHIYIIIVYVGGFYRLLIYFLVMVYSYEVKQTYYNVHSFIIKKKHTHTYIHTYE